MTHEQKLAMVGAGIILAVLLLLGMLLPRPQSSVETVLVASVTWVPPNMVPLLEEQYWDSGIVPLCADLPTVQEFDITAKPVACFLEVAK